jgi:ABC-type Fe3+ transport system substrate-binding protein
MLTINCDLSIKTVAEKYPSAIQLLKGYGINDLDEHFIKKYGSAINLDTLLKTKNINVDAFMNVLNEKINSVETISEVSDEQVNASELNFLAYVVCPIKLLFEDGLKNHLRKTVPGYETKYSYLLPSGCSSIDAYDKLWQADTIDQLPDIIVSVGFGDYFRLEFVKKFVEKGYFKTANPTPYKKEYLDAGIIDPAGWYTVYAASPFIILADKKKLNGKIPTSWESLLSPEYENRIMACGHNSEEIESSVLVSYYKMFGEDGVKRISKNIHSVSHSSRLAKLASTGSDEGTGIYIISYFFANNAIKNENVSIVWPDEGAFVSPLYMISKRDKMEALSPFIDYVTGKDLGQITSSSFLPSCNPFTDNKLPGNGKLFWPGWSFLREHDMFKLQKDLLDVFLRDRR